MKKLFIVMLVLGVASAANAAIVGLSIDGATVSDGTEDILQNSTIQLFVVSDTANFPYILDIKVLKAHAFLSMPMGNPGCPPPIDYSDDTWWSYELSTGGSPDCPPFAGVQWTMSLTPLGALGDVFTVYLGPYGGAPVSTIDFRVVPEPVTIALLGLGGLFLLRRRK